ncbi:MAG: hypothetical protein Q8P95_00565 [bacterium]|nr:hypothetical protein [bacterium]
MQIEEFIAFVQECGFLGKDRQKELIANAKWMSAAERAFVVSSIKETQATIQANEEKFTAQLDTAEQALKFFQKEELPKFIKEQEKVEQDQEKGTADDLLGSL